MSRATTDLLVDRRGVARFMGRSFPCALGRGGVTTDKREGDGATPAGTYRLEEVWFRPDRIAEPITVLPTHSIGPSDGWSDDPEDQLYNRHIRRPRSYRHEILRRGDGLYDVLAVFDANRRPVERGRGSALFLHVWRRPRFPTAGCVAFPRNDLLSVLALWRPECRLVIRRD